jgi:hypothetical protein
MVDPTCPEQISRDFPQEGLPNWQIEWQFASDIEEVYAGDFPPLVEDAPLQQLRYLFDRRDGQMIRALVVGTFFYLPPTAQPEDAGRFPRGGEHPELVSGRLFVVSRVESVQTDYAPELDYSPMWATNYPNGCYSKREAGVPTNDVIRSWQKVAESNKSDWRYDPQKVAKLHLRGMQSAAIRVSDSVERLGGLDEKLENAASSSDARPTGTLLETHATTFRKEYEFISSDRKSRTVIIVARPFWLEGLAGSLEKVIWAPVASAEFGCLAPGEKIQRPQAEWEFRPMEAPETNTEDDEANN